MWMGVFHTHVSKHWILKVVFFYLPEVSLMSNKNVPDAGQRGRHAWPREAAPVEGTDHRVFPISFYPFLWILYLGSPGF